MKLFTPEISWHQKEPVFSVDFCPNSWKLASCGGDFTIKIWLVKEDSAGNIGLEFLSNLDRHTKPVNVVRFSPDGKTLASAGDDGAIILWRLNDSEKPAADIFAGDDVENKEIWAVFKMLRGHIEGIYDLAWSPDSSQLITGSVDNSAIVWDANKGQSQKIITDHKHYVQGVCWDPRGFYIATHSTDRSCRLYSSSTQRCLHNIHKSTYSYMNGGKLTKSKLTRMFMDETMKSFFRRCSFTPDGSFLILPAGLCDGDDKPQKTAYVFARGHFSRPVYHLPGSKKATVAVKCSPVVYELLDNKENIPTMPAASNQFFTVPYRMVFAVADLDAVTFYDTQHSQPIGHVANMHYASLTDMTWSSDGRLVIVSSMDGYCSFVKFDETELGTKISFDPIDYQVTQAKIRKAADRENIPYLERASNAEKAVKPDKAVQIEKVVQVEKAGKAEKLLKAEKAVKAEKSVKVEKVVKPEEAVKADKDVAPKSGDGTKSYVTSTSCRDGENDKDKPVNSTKNQPTIDRFVAPMKRKRPSPSPPPGGSTDRVTSPSSPEKPAAPCTSGPTLLSPRPGDQTPRRVPPIALPVHAQIAAATKPPRRIELTTLQTFDEIKSSSSLKGLPTVTQTEASSSLKGQPTVSQIEASSSLEGQPAVTQAKASSSLKGQSAGTETGASSSIQGQPTGTQKQPKRVEVVTLRPYTNPHVEVNLDAGVHMPPEPTPLDPSALTAMHQTTPLSKGPSSATTVTLSATSAEEKDAQVFKSVDSPKSRKSPPKPVIHTPSKPPKRVEVITIYTPEKPDQVFTSKPFSSPAKANHARALLSPRKEALAMSPRKRALEGDVVSPSPRRGRHAHCSNPASRRSLLSPAPRDLCVDTTKGSNKVSQTNKTVPALSTVSDKHTKSDIPVEVDDGVDGGDESEHSIALAPPAKIPRVNLVTIWSAKAKPVTDTRKSKSPKSKLAVDGKDSVSQSIDSPPLVVLD